MSASHPPGRPDPASPIFQDNAARMAALVHDLIRKMAGAAQGGGPAALARHRAKGRLTARERLALLLDPGAPFLELSPLAGLGLYDFDVPGAGLITGIGRVMGRLVMVAANDPTVKGGTYAPITVKKHLRAQDIAAKLALPVLTLVESGGANLDFQDQVFPDRDHFGRIFFHQARLSAAGIPQIAVVLGSCTAGGAYLPAMCDETIIVRGQGTIFLAGPPLVKAATGEEVTPEELGGADLHATRSGLVDHVADDDAQAMGMARNLVGHLGGKPYAPLPGGNDPVFPTAWLDGLAPLDLRQSPDMRAILACLLDGPGLDEFKPAFGPTLICGFARLYGADLGVIANNGVLFGESAQKGTHFIQLCCRRRIPLLFVQNVTGFMVGAKYEAEGIAKEGAKMVQAVANAAIPKITLVVGGSFGAGNYAMCGRAYDPDFLFTWPNARISVMGAEQAARVLGQVQKGADANAIRDRFDRQGHPYYATARLWDDGIIAPARTRRVLGLALAACLNGPTGETRFGVFRM